MNKAHLVDVRSPLCQRKLSTSPLQAILDLFKHVLAPEFSSGDAVMGARLRRIKALFVQRDYDAIFNTPAHLPVYVCEYVPSRVLCYVDLALTWRADLLPLLQRGRLSVCAVGGGAGSDVVFVAAARALIASGTEGKTGDDDSLLLSIHTVDMGEWGDVVARLVHGIQSEWELPIASTFDQFNVLQMGDPGSQAQTAGLTKQLTTTELVTLMFTVNELFQLNKGRAISFMQALLQALPRGAHVLIVDSAGDFSELKVGSRTFMVYTLLDAIKGWEKVQGHDSKWYRFPDKLSYPLELNNMRYFARLYRKL